MTTLNNPYDKEVYMEGITSKDQERDALRKIHKIVESLGENSYIATAFEGCFELAEENIENDFACSLKQDIKALKKRWMNGKQDTLP